MKCIKEETPNNAITCKIYPVKAHACSNVIGGELVVSKPQIDIADDTLKTLIQHTTFIGDANCADFFIRFACMFLFSKCVKSADNTTTQQLFPQKICAKTCLHMHDNICKGKLNILGGVIAKSETVVVHESIKKLLLCVSCQNSTLFPLADDNLQPSCFMENSYSNFASKSEKCDGNGFVYNGNLSTTISGLHCKPWSDTSFSTDVLLEQSFCRNPNGYRDTAWCFVNTTCWERCKVTTCPGIDRGFTSWSMWSQCDRLCQQYRTRNCTHYTWNCTGPTNQTQSCLCKVKEKSQDALYSLIGVGLLLMIIVIIVVKVRFTKKSSDEEEPPSYETPIATANDVNKILNHRTDEEMFVDCIYEAITQFKNCLCASCISDWLIDAVKNSTHVDSVVIENEVSRLMSKLRRDQSEDIMLPGKMHDDCLAEHEVRTWVEQNAVYDKLKTDDKTSGTVPRLVFGALTLDENVYDKIGLHKDEYQSTIF